MLPFSTQRRHAWLVFRLSTQDWHMSIFRPGNCQGSQYGA